MKRPRNPRPPQVAATLVLALVAVAWWQPWFVVETSSGTKSPPGGPSGPDDTSVERNRWETYPGRVQGPAPPLDADNVAGRLGIAMTALSVMAASAFVLAFTFGAKPWARRTGLALASIVALGAAAQAFLAWFALPAAFASVGVEGPFTSRRIDDGYVWTTLHAGWAAMVALVPACFVLVGATYLGNPPDVDELERRRATNATRAGAEP